MAKDVDKKPEFTEEIMNEAEFIIKCINNKYNKTKIEQEEEFVIKNYNINTGEEAEKIEVQAEEFLKDVIFPAETSSSDDSESNNFQAVVYYLNLPLS